jgi:hypothetical protein
MLMENRGLKNRVTISNSIDRNLSEKLNQLSVDTMIPKSKLLDKAIKLLLDEYSKAAK